jgi:hypothetical protein
MMSNQSELNALVLLLEDSANLLKKDAEIITALYDQVAALQHQNTFLISELKVAAKGFAHHGLEGHAWLSQQAINHVRGQK